MAETLEQKMATGWIGEAYTQKTFLRIYHALKIDKVKMSFANVGTHGEGADVYISSMVFDRLADDILSGELKKQLLDSKKNDAGYFIPVWKYETGEKVCKKVTIGRGTKQPIVINGIDTVSGKNIMVTTTYANLIDVAKLWKLVSKPYFTNLMKIGYEARNSYTPDTEEQP